MAKGNISIKDPGMIKCIEIENESLRMQLEIKLENQISSMSIKHEINTLASGMQADSLVIYQITGH